MDEISNRALAVLLVAAIIVSLGGTIMVLNKGPKTQYLTGFATSDTGNVSLSVATSISITTADSNAINFGSCTTPSGSGVVQHVDSEVGGSTSSRCTSFTTPKNITVRNDGNVNVNVSMTPTNWGEAAGGTFLAGPSAASWLAYNVKEGFAVYGGTQMANGCFNNTVMGYNSSSWNAYTNITNANPKVICANLTADNTANSVGVYIAFGIPNDALTGSDNVTFSFLGQTI